MTLCKCRNCKCKFRNITNLNKHRRKNHPQQVRNEIRNGIRNSKKTPQAKNKELSKVISDIGGVVLGITPAILTRNPTLALGAAGEITKLVNSVKEYLED